MTPEGRIKKEIRQWLGTLPNCWYFMPVSNGMGSHGVPDLIICYKGVFVGIECKAPGKLLSPGPTPLQKIQIRAINQAMGYAIATDNLKDVQGLFADIDVMLVHAYRTMKG